jgi:hypothetical protein
MRLLFNNENHNLLFDFARSVKFESSYVSFEAAPRIKKVSFSWPI